MAGGQRRERGYAVDVDRRAMFVETHWVRKRSLAILMSPVKSVDDTDVKAAEAGEGRRYWIAQGYRL